MGIICNHNFVEMIIPVLEIFKLKLEKTGVCVKNWKMLKTLKNEKRTNQNLNNMPRTSTFITNCVKFQRNFISKCINCTFEETKLIYLCLRGQFYI
jgi:hypothetical protein